MCHTLSRCISIHLTHSLISAKGIIHTNRIYKHPDKTFIGKVDRGFDFLGYFLKPGMVNVSISTLKRFVQRINRLYEQGADYLRIGEYVKHWFKWVRTGIGEWANMKSKESIKKHLHPSTNEE